MADDLIPNQIIVLVSIILSLLCIYASGFNLIGGILVIISAILSTVYGTNTLRHIGKYSLGTGVPSIVYMLTSIALVSYILSMIISIYAGISEVFPIIALLVTALFSYLISLICRHIFKIQVEILSKSFVSISVAAVLLMLSMSCLISQTYNPNVIYENVIQNALILLLMIMSVMAIQNPYNACMGPNEDQYRTLALACSNAFLMLMVTSVLSMIITRNWIIYLLISLIGWFIFFRQYVKYTKHQAASVRRYGLWPMDDGDG